MKLPPGWKKVDAGWYERKRTRKAGFAIIIGSKREGYLADGPRRGVAGYTERFRTIAEAFRALEPKP